MFSDRVHPKRINGQPGAILSFKKQRDGCPNAFSLKAQVSSLSVFFEKGQGDFTGISGLGALQIKGFKDRFKRFMITGIIRNLSGRMQDLSLKKRFAGT